MVREQPDPSSLEEETASLILRVIESLSLESHCSSNITASNPGKDYKSDSSLPRARISKSRPSYSPSPSTSSGSTGKNDKEFDENNKPNIRASSVPRPRAVLSSPDNDGMIGHQNQLSRERQTPLKRQSLSQNTATQCKPTPRNARVQSPMNTRKVSKEAGNNNHPKAKPRSDPAVQIQRQRVPSWKGKSKPAGI